MDFFGKDKLSRLDEERQRRRQQRADEALRRLEEVGKQTQQLVANHATQTRTSAPNEASDASGRRPGGLSRVLFEQATGGRGDRRKNKLDPRNILSESQKALSQIDGAMSTIKSSVVDATGAGLRGGLEEASKSVTDIVDRVASLANGTVGTLSPSANKNPLAELMAEEQQEEHKQRGEAAADETEDSKAKLSLENKLDTIKTIAEKATGLDLGEKRGGDDDEGSFQFQSQLAGLLPHEAMNAVMSGASVNLREIAANAASHMIAAGDKGNGILSTAGEAAGDLLRGEDAKTIATNAIGNFGGEKIGGLIGGKAGDIIGGVAGGVFGDVLGGDKPKLGDVVTNAVNAISPFGGVNPFGGIVNMAMGAANDAAQGAAQIFDPTNVANIAINAATMSPQNLVDNATQFLDPANAVANITEKLGAFDANAMISNIGNALDPMSFTKMAGAAAGGLPGLAGNLVGIAGQAFENVTARLKDTAEALNPFANNEEVVSPRDPASGLPTGKRQHKPFSFISELDPAAGRATPENPAGDPSAMITRGAQGAVENVAAGVAAGAASEHAIANTSPLAKPEGKPDAKADAKPTDSKADAKAKATDAKENATDGKDAKATDPKGDAKHDAKAGDKAGEKDGTPKKKGADDDVKKAGPKGEAAAKSHDPAGAKGAAQATAHAGTATREGEAAARATGAAAATANASTGHAAPARGPQPGAQQAPQSNRPLADRARAAQPTRAANTANRNAAPVSAASGGQTQINVQPVMSPAERDVAQNEKQVTQPNVNIEARGESGALPGMPADLASQTPTPAGAQAATPAAPAPAATPTAPTRTVAPLATVAAQPTTATKANPPTAVTMPQAKPAPMAAGGAPGATGATPQPKASSGASQAGAQSVPAAAKPAPPPPAAKIPEQKAAPGSAAPQTPATQAPEPNIPPVRAPGGEGAPSPSGMVPATANLSADRSNAQGQLTAEAQTQSRVGPEANTMKQSQVASQKPAFEQTKRSGDAPRQQAVTASTAQGQQAGQAGQQRGHAAAQSGNQQIQGQGQQASGERGQLQGVAAGNSAAVLAQTSPAVMQGASAPAQAAVQAAAAAGRAQQAIVNPSAVARAGQAGATNSQLPPFNAGQFNQIDQQLAQPMPETDMAAAEQSKLAADQTYQQANTQIDQLANIQPPAINAPQSAGAGTVTKDGHPTRESAIANVEQQVTAQAQAQGPAKMQEAARPLQDEVKQHATSAQQAATTSADSQLQQHQAKAAEIKQTPPPTTGAQAAAEAQPQYQAHQAEATAASTTMKAEIAGAQTTANTATQQAKTARDQQITQAQAAYQQQSASAQGQYTQAQATAKGQFDSQNQASQQAMATEQQNAQQAATQQTTQAQQKADSDIAQQNAQLNSQQQAANASHQQQMEAANQQHDAQVQAANAQMDTDVSTQQSQMQSQVSAEQSRGQTEVNQHLTEGEQGYQREVQAGEQEAAAEQQRAQAEAAEKERQAQAEKDKNSGGLFGKVVGWVKDRFDDMMNAAKAVLAAARDMIVGIMERARQAAIAVLQRARQAALAALAKVKSAIQGIISACASAIRSIISACAAMVRNLIQNLANMLKSLVQALTTLLQTLVQAFQAAVNALLDGLIAAVSLINKDLGDKLRSATQKYRDAFNNAMNTLSSNIKAAGDALQAKIQQAADGAIAVVNAAEQNLNAAVTRVEQTLNAAVETAYQAGAAAINRAFDAAEAVVNKAFEVAKAAVEAYFNAQIAALDLVQQAVGAVADFVIAVADKVLEAVAKIAEAIINMIPESWTKWFVDFWNGPWRQAIIIGLATVAAVAITVATCGAAGPVAMILIAGLIGGTIAGTAYAGGEILAREGAIDLTENHPGEGVYVPGVGNVQIQIGPDGKPIPPANLTPEQQAAWEKNSQWALSNFNTERDAEGNVTGYDRKSGSEIANYAVQEGIKGFGEGFISSAGAMGGSLAGGAVAGLGFVGRVASNPVARQMIATAVEGGVGVVSQSVGSAWTAGFDAMAEGKSPGEAFSAAWKAGSEQITDPGNWVAALATVGVVPLKTQAIAPLMNRVTGRVANQTVKTVINEGVDVVVDTAAETVGNAGGAFVSTYYKAINEGKTPAEAMAAARTAANDSFKPEAIAQSLLMNVAGNQANKGAEAYAARRAGATPDGTPNATPDRTPDPTPADPTPRQSADPTPASDGRPLADRPTTARTADGVSTPDNNPRTTRGGDESNPTPRTTDSDSSEVQRTRPAAGQDTAPPVKHSSEPTARDVAPIRERRDGAPIREGDSSDPQPLRGQDGQPIKTDDADTSATTQKPKDTDEPQRFQDRETDQARIDQQMTDKGHSGIEVHSHFMGNVDPANFAATIGRSGEAPMLPRNPDGETAAQRVGDHSPYEPVMREIAKLNDFRHTTAEGPNGEQIITTRGRSGDALMQIDAAQQRIETLKSRIESEGDTMSPVERQRIEQEIHDEARSAVEKALRASDETDFNSSYEVRDELVKKFYGAAERNDILTSRGVDPKNARMTDPKVIEAYTEHFTGRREIQERIPQAVEAQRRLDAGDYADPKERKALQKQADSIREQMAYDAYAKETLLRLAQDNITYTEQSNSINKIGARFDEGQIDWLKSQLIKEHPEHAAAIQNLTVKHVTMINTNQFGVRGDQHRGDQAQVKTGDLHEAAGTVRPSDAEFSDSVKQLVEQTRRGDVVGVDIAGAEHFTFDGEGQRRMTELYDALLTEAGRPGGNKPIVLRPHVGEGANDVVPGQVGHRDANRQIVDGENGPELSHYQRAKENLDNMLTVFEQIAARPENGGRLPPDVVVRFGHATHTTPEMAARMAKLGIIAEVNLTSNIETGSVSQKPPTDLAGGQDNTHTPEAQPTRYELDPSKRGGTLDDHALATLIAADAPVILSTDAHSVMSTNMKNEYDRARAVIEEVRNGRRQVPIDESIIDPSKPPGTSRLMSYDEMPQHLKDRFDRAERKLYEDANRYYDMRPKQDDAPATPDRVGKPISQELAAKVDALQEGESVTIGRRGGKDGLVEHLRNKDVEFGIFRDAEGSYYVIRGGEDYLAPRNPNDRLIAHNHPGGTKHLSADDLDYMHSSTNGKQRSTLLLTPGDEGGVSRERVSDYTRTRPAENDPSKGPIREVPDAPEPTAAPEVTPAARTKPPTESSLETVLSKSGKTLADYQNADSWELQSLATQLLAAKGIKQPTESQKSDTLFKLDQAIKKGDTTFEAPFEAGALKKEDGVNDRLGNIFGEKRVFSADELTPDRLKMNDSERRALEGGFESGVAGQVRAASFINAHHRSEGDFSHAYGGDAWKNQLRAETYLNSIPKGSFVDGLSIETMQEVNRLIHTPDTGMKAQMLRGLAYVGRGFKWDEGGQVRDGKQYARPEQYSAAELDNLHEAGVRTKQFPLGMGHQLQYPDPADVRPRMNKLIADLKAELAKPDADPIGAAAQFQRHFVALHPFGDSNGRTSRALMNRILLEFDMPPAIFADQNRDMSMSPAEWREEVAKGVARSKDYLGKSGRNSKDEYVGKITGTALTTTSPNKPITVDGLPFDLGADGFLYDPTGRPYMAQNGELIPMAQLEHYMMSRRVAAAGKDQAPNLLASTNESTRQFYDQIAADPEAGKGIKVRDDGRARTADQEYRLNPDPEVAAMLAKLTDTGSLDPTKAFTFDANASSSWSQPNGNGTRNSAVMSKYTQMDLELWYIEKGLRNSKQPELVEQVRANRAKLFEMARAEMEKASDPSRVSAENPHGFRYKYEQMMHDTSPLRFASFDEAIHELGDKRMTVWRGDYSFSKLIGMAPNNDVRQPDAKAVSDQRTKKSQITDIYDDLTKLEGSAVGRQYICTTSDLALLVGAFANNKKAQTVSLSSLPAPIRDRLLGWMDPQFPDGTTAEDKAKARQAALDRKEWVVPTEDGGKEIRDFAGIPGTVLKMRVVDKASGQVEIMAERKAFQIDLDKEAFLPGIYSLGGPSFEAEQELHGLETVRPWKIKGTHEASTLKEEFPVTSAAPAAPAPTTPSDGGGVGFGSGEGALAYGEGAPGMATPEPTTDDAAAPATAAAEVTMETEWDAADGSGKTRTDVGVGERVFLTADSAGAWAATTGTATGTGDQFTWTAPATTGAVTITFTPTGGGAAITKTLNVVAPTSVVLTKVSDDTFGAGTVGAGFVANVAFHPLNVSFAATMWKEDTGQRGTAATGDFRGRGAPTLPVHTANPNWLGIGADNSGPTDHAAFSFTGATFTNGGSFKWAIAQRWKLRSAAAANGLIQTLDQTCVVTGAPHAGRTTVSKGGASATRNPDGTDPTATPEAATEGEGRGRGYADEGPPTSRSAVGEGLSTDGATQKLESPEQLVVGGRGVDEAKGYGVGDSTKDAKLEAPPSEEYELPPEVKDFAVSADGWHALVRTSWVKQNPVPNVIEMLTQMQRLGAFTWAKPEGIKRAAEETQIVSGHEVVRYDVTLRSLAMMGLPPLAGSMVAREGDELLIALRVPGAVVKKDADNNFVSVALGMDEINVTTRALEKFTGLKSVSYVQVTGFTVRDGIMEIPIPDEEAARIFGKKAWEGWKKSRAPKDGDKSGVPATDADKPTETGSDLSFMERVRVEKWMKDNLGLAETGMATHVDRTLLNVIDEIEADPDLKPYIKQLLQKDMKGVGTPAHAFSLQDLLERARSDKERKRLGLAEPGKADKEEEAFKYFIPVRIAQKGDVIAGREMALNLVWDWELFKTGMSANNVAEFARRHWHMEVDWVVERTDKPDAKPWTRRTTHDRSEIGIGHAFNLEKGEKRGLFMVHAFISTSHFAPMHITAPLEVKTESARMEELRATSMGDMMAPDTKREDYEFDLHSVTQDALGGDGDTKGSKFTGGLKEGFKNADPAQRAKDRADEMELNKKMIAYLKAQETSGGYGYSQAIAAAEKHQKSLEEADKKIKGDQAAGWTSFDLRGTYLSRNGQAASGSLNLYGFVRPAEVISGTTITDMKKVKGFEVKIRDLSNKIESDLEFEASGVDFHTALREAFLKICKNYPEGKMTLLAEDHVFDAASSPKANGKTVGFELATTSAWKRVKSKVFDPVVQVLSNAAAMALMIIFPPSAAVIMPIMAVQSIVQTVDDLYTKHDKGKLDMKETGIGLLKIGLDVLPAARGAKFLNPARTTIQELKSGLNLRLVAFDALRIGTEVLVMREEARNQIAEIQEKQIGVMAEKYRALLELDSKDMNTSDPAIAQMRIDIEKDAEAIRKTTQTVWTNVVANRAAYLVGPQFLGTDHSRAKADPDAPVYHGREKVGDDGATHHDDPSQTRRHDDDPHATTPKRDGGAKAADSEPHRSIDLENVVLAGQDGELRRAAAAVPKQSGTLDVMVHGTVDDFVVLHNGEKVHIDHRSLAKYVKKSGEKADRIRLLACEAGKHPKGAAQQFANKTGATVIAPSDKLYIHLNEDGSFHSMTIGPHPKRDTGKWIEFKPQKSSSRSTKAKDPGDKPRERAKKPDVDTTTHDDDAARTTKVGDDDGGTSGRADKSAARKVHEGEFATHEPNVTNEANGPVNDARKKVDLGGRWKEAEDDGRAAYKEAFRDEYLKLRADGVDEKKAIPAARSAARKAAIGKVNQVAIEVAEQRARDAITKDTNSDGVPDAFKESGAGMRHDLGDYGAGTRGKVAREVSGELPNKTVAEMEALLVAKGGTRDPATGAQTVKEGASEYPQIAFTFPDGTLVRIKPEGDNRNSKKPMYSVEMFIGTPNAAAKNPQDNVAFKVDTAGNPVPKGKEAIENPYKNPEQKAAFDKEVLRRGHHLAKES